MPQAIFFTPTSQEEEILKEQTKITIRREKKIKEKRGDEIVSLFSSAFNDDRMMDIICNGSVEFRDGLIRTHLKDAADFGKVYGAEIGKELVGVVLCYPPGVDQVQKDDEAELRRYAHLLPLATPTHRKWLSDCFVPAFHHSLAQVLGPNYRKDAWELSLMAVSPDFQGHGIARALVQHLFHKAKSSASFVLCTGSETNVAIFERFDFKVRSESETLGSKPCNNFTMRWMVREPPKN